MLRLRLYLHLRQGEYWQTWLAEYHGRGPACFCNTSLPPNQATAAAGPVTRLRHRLSALASPSALHIYLGYLASHGSCSATLLHANCSNGLREVRRAPADLPSCIALISLTLVCSLLPVSRPTPPRALLHRDSPRDRPPRLASATRQVLSLWHGPWMDLSGWLALHQELCCVLATYLVRDYTARIETRHDRGPAWPPLVGVLMGS